MKTIPLKQIPNFQQLDHEQEKTLYNSKTGEVLGLMGIEDGVIFGMVERNLVPIENWHVVEPDENFLSISLKKIEILIRDGGKVIEITSDYVKLEFSNNSIATVDNFGKVMWIHD